ncbi:MAG TPA: glutamate-5-semialdehyde dehydrogenase, partial [Caldimonas sp.]|nr:glutamate-5-semialdehyde dehydrogenase [Caldimonas sp.]
MASQARAASRALAASPVAARNAALRSLASSLRAAVGPLAGANRRDLDAGLAAGLSPPLVERLRLGRDAIETVALGCEQIAAMADPIGAVSGLVEQPSGIRVGRMRVPIGVFAMIYESRPNVTIEAASLAIKSGNACILRGGSEALHSNLALAALVRDALAGAGLPPDAVQLVGTTDRAAVGHLIAAEGAVDLVIPRGGKGLIERIAREAKVPVLKHLDGNCHVYVDAAADLAMALAIVDNAKTQKLSPCNAAESLLVHADVAASFLPAIGAVFAAKGIEMRCDPQALALLGGVAGAKLVPAAEADWSEEYLAAIISIKVVASLDAAMSHIDRYGSHHTDAIVTADESAAKKFLTEVDSAIVLHNASTQFADGGEFGFGAEIGIATGRMHARGPVGVEQLTTFKYRIRGTG